MRAMAVMSPDISVVIPTLNSSRTIAACLEAVNRESAEVVVVDDCSSDDTQEIARLHGATVIEITKKSAAAARNLGVAHSTGGIIAYTDADCLPAPGWLDAIRTAFGESPDVDIIGGSIRFREDTMFRRAYAAMYHLIDEKSFADGSNMLPAMNLSVRRRVFKELVFDETLPGALCDDVDFLQRALSLGKKIRYHPEIVVTHLNPANFRSYIRQEIRHGMGDLIFRRRYPESAAAKASA